MTSADRTVRCLAAAALLLLAACSREVPVVSLEGPTMGTQFSVRIAGAVADPEALGEAIRIELAGINALMSTWQPDSELSLFNAAESLEWWPVSQATADVVAAALAVNVETAGALDVTVGPLVNLWGFGPAAVAPVRPAEALLEATRERVGADLLEVRGEPPALRKARPDVYVDLSAIAKGYAVDRLGELLEASGVESYLVDIGGELRARGRPAEDRGWRVAIERPLDVGRSIQRIIEPGDNGVATSGDYRNYFERDGRRFAHVIDPRSGEPVLQTLASVTVLAPETMRADALATALLVMGKDDALAFAIDRGIPVLLIERSDDGFLEHATPAMTRHLIDGGTS
ncbi:MAG: FAD:protein FMN transferase [Pseudomonadota bacterium]